jgi:thymidylate synthase
MLAQQTGYKPYELVHHTVDSHIYVDQIDGVEEYLSREKPVSPRLELNKAKSIDEYELEDFELADYNPLSAIKIPVAV